MILSLLSMFGGGIMRLLPEVFSFMNKKTDNEHELAMLEKQFQLEQTRSASRMAEIQEQGDVDQSIALLEAQKTALESQMQKTGIRWVDAMNFSVRPLYALSALGFYYLIKIAMFIIALRSGLSGWDSILKIYTEADFAFLTSISSFYFVGRIFDKKK